MNLCKMYCQFCEKKKESSANFLPPPASFATTAIHFAQDPDSFDSHAVVPPLVNSNTFKQRAPGDFDKFLYGRIGNPTRDTLEAVTAALDGGKFGFIFASGLGAITTLYSLLSKGDHILCCDDVYGGTNRLFRHVTTRMGIEATFVDFTDLESVKKGIQSNTKMIWIETPSNPMLKVIDIAEVSKIGKAREDIIVVVDNTFLTSYLQKPLDFGADVSMYSMTKYMNGHSDVIMGAVVTNCPKLAEKLKFLQYIMGIIPSPIDCYLVLRSLKTLAIRMKQHKKSSLEIAKWLQKHPKVKVVHHPGLPEHPHYEIAAKQTVGHSGCFSFEHTGGLHESKKIFKNLKLFALAESLGGYESLAELPSVMTHASISAAERKSLGISDALIRLSVGLEDCEDLIKDLNQAFEKAFTSCGGCDKSCVTCQRCG